MPLCQSALVGFVAAEIAGFICDQNDVPKSQKELWKAGACATFGGAVGAATLDPAGLGIVAAETITHLICAAMGGEPEYAKHFPPGFAMGI